MGMVARKGMGTVRHIEVGELWIQDAVRNNVLTVNKLKAMIILPISSPNTLSKVRSTNIATVCG